MGTHPSIVSVYGICNMLDCVMKRYRVECRHFTSCMAYHVHVSEYSCETYATVSILCLATTHHAIACPVISHVTRVVGHMVLFTLLST